MRKFRLTVLWAGLVVGTGLVLFISAQLEGAVRPYPGATLIAPEQIQINSIGRSSLSRQAQYQTHDDVLTVRHWYAAHYTVGPEEEKNVLNECIWLHHSQMILWVEHTVTLLLCPMPYGTRITLNESAYVFWP